MSLSFVLFSFAARASVNDTSSRLLQAENRLPLEATTSSFRRLAEVALASASGGSSEVHYQSDCELGYGYDIWKQHCMSSPAIQIPSQCTDSDDYGANCVDKDTQTSSGWTSYNVKTQSSDDYSNLIDSAVSAEGTGWGFSASVSCSYMQEHSVSNNAIGFWVGQSGDAYNTFLRNPLLLELNTAAKFILQTDWRTFINTYGTHYVKKMIHSTNFIGSAQITSTSESSSSDLSVAATMSYTGFFSASGSVNYDEATQSTKSSLKVRVNSFYHGEILSYKATTVTNDDGTTTEKNPAQLLDEDYRTWKENVKTDPEGNSYPTRLVFRPLLDIQEVQQTIVDNYDSSEWPTILSAFSAGMPTQQTLVTLSQESVWTGTQLNNLELYETYDCVKENDELEAAVSAYKNLLNSHLVELENLDGAGIMFLEDQIIANNYTWFIGRDLAITKEIEDRLAECPTPDMCKCVSPGGNTDKNHISCSESGSRRCSGDEVCYGEEEVEFGDWTKLCTTDYCVCDGTNILFNIANPQSAAYLVCLGDAPRRPSCGNRGGCTGSGIWKYGQWEKFCQPW